MTENDNKPPNHDQVELARRVSETLRRAEKLVADVRESQKRAQSKSLEELRQLRFYIL